MLKSVLILLSFLTLGFSKFQQSKLAAGSDSPYIHVYFYDNTISSQQCQAAISSEQYVLSGMCYQMYESTTSSTTTGSYMLSIQSSGEGVVYTEYSDTSCMMYAGDTTFSNGGCQYTGETNYISVSVSVESNPVLLPGMYYVGYKSKSDCENMIDRPASYVLKYPTDQCTPDDGVYFHGLCQANGNISYSVYTNPACSGTALKSGILAPPGPPNHGCISRLSIGDDYESSDSTSEWVRFYCGTNQAFPGMDSPTPLPAVVPSLKPSTAIVNSFSGYLKQEFFTDSNCADPYKTVFTASGKCIDSLASQYNNADFSRIYQFTIEGDQVIKDVGYYHGLGCGVLNFQYTESTTASCSPYPDYSDGGDNRKDLYVMHSFVAGTATPTVPFVGIISTSTFATYEDCNNGLKPTVMAVYRNNTCFQSYQMGYSSYYASASGICLPEGASYTLQVTARNNTGICAASANVIYQYTNKQQGPGCQLNGDSTWRLGNVNQCGSTLPSAATAPTSQPTVAVVEQFTGYLKQEFFTDSDCLHPFKTLFSSSGRCSNTFASQYSSANSSVLKQFTVVGGQVIKDVVHYHGLDCKDVNYRENSVVTSTTCSLYPYSSEDGDSRQDLYVIQSFLTGTATPSVPYVGIITNSFFATYDDCKNGVKPTFFAVYPNNTCYTSVQYGSYKYSTKGVCHPQGESYSLHTTAYNNVTSCAAKEGNYRYTNARESDPVCDRYYPSSWRLRNAQCGSTLPNLLVADVPSGAPVQLPSTADTSQPNIIYSSQPFAAHTSKPITTSSKPIASPLRRPSAKPTSRRVAPSFAPSKHVKVKTAEPTASSTKKPRRPSQSPTKTPTKKPSVRSAAPTRKPTRKPTKRSK